MLTIPSIESVPRPTTSIPAPDPVYARMDYPFVRRFYPLGFPVDVETNSAAVIRIAAEAWENFNPLFDTAPLLIKIGVLPGRSAECPPATQCRVQNHLFSFTADQDNFGIADLATGFSSLWLTTAAVANPTYLRHFFLECAMFCQISNRYATGVHSACVARNGVGVLLCGDSGAGKSTLAYACAKAGWDFITDDGSFIAHDREELLAVGNCFQFRFRPETRSIFPEVGNGPITYRSEASKPSIEIASRSMRGIRLSQSAIVKHAVFLIRDAGVNAGFNPCSKPVTRGFLMRARFSLPEVMARHSAVVDRILELDVRELRYRDLDWAVEQLVCLTESASNE